MVTLAEATGWSEEFILWALPLARGEQYLHAILVSHGANTRPTANALKELLEPEVV